MQIQKNEETPHFLLDKGIDLVFGIPNYEYLESFFPIRMMGFTLRPQTIHFLDTLMVCRCMQVI